MRSQREPNIKALSDEYHRIRENHLKAELIFFARTVLGSSVIRVFVSGTKEDVISTLIKLNVMEIGRCRNQEDFCKWYEKALSLVGKAVNIKNATNSKVQPGYLWGHSAKILNLFLRDIVMHSRLFNDDTVARVSPWLYCPIDNIIIIRAKALGCPMPVKAIKEIGTRALFYDIQGMLEKAADNAGVPRVWLDDNWGDRQ